MLTPRQMIDEALCYLLMLLVLSFPVTLPVLARWLFGE